MKNRKIYLFLGLVVVLLIAFLSFRNYKDMGYYNTFSGHEFGEHGSMAYGNTFKFDKSIGNYIKYEVENIGSDDIFIKLNDGEEKSIKSNEKGSLSYELKKGNEVLTFKAYPKAFSKADKVDIKYDIKQN